ncbi:hypothetical protein CAPTEDRAFT_19536 [Capitella teleta]|uniref:Fibrinogen C-terminal domain-containing protein n=1 Tax=Capitella teleta TaxID=283909 RepID=R7UX82_CAPTE|nr:hypothetical protein CAPTEDRAFT_19536 [Capitella teleta]|eukprot:ELU08522.1 hypothetical protein CAPTEDRAFT_19536 [Capitella teleta]
MTRVGVSCKELRSRGHSVSGLYTIWSLDTGDVRVYCDMVTDGGGWLVFQRRKDGSQDFFLTWAEYAAGFGDLNGEFWLGNRNLHALTAKQPHELRIDFKDNGDAAFAKYSIFKVGPESDEFRLEIRGYSGDAGDTMGYHNGMKFSAKDQDHDTWSGGDCANKYKGGWWYYYCHDANLNGLYLNGAYTGYTRGIDWSKWKGYHYSIQFTEMKIRPID